jgi:hypothetical protein
MFFDHKLATSFDCLEKYALASGMHNHATYLQLQGRSYKIIDSLVGKMATY